MKNDHEVVDIPRSIIATISVMMNFIPDEGEHHDLFYGLEKVKTSAMYAAPELENEMWQRLTMVLFDHYGANISKSLNDWEFAIMAVLSTKTIDEIRRESV